MRVLLRLLLGATALICVLILGAILAIQSNWFHDLVRTRLISTIEEVSGGRVEIGSFEFDWRHLTATVAPFVLHGKEPPGHAPFLRADRIQIGMRIVSALSRRVDLATLTADKPQLSIVAEPNGETNVPVPRHRRKNLIQDLMDARIGQCWLENGFAEYNSRRVPLDLKASGVNINLRYEARGQDYTGDVKAKSVWLTPDTEFGFESRITLDQSRLRIASAKFTDQKSTVEASGTVEDFASPHGVLALQASLRLEDLNRSVRGGAAFDGKLAFESTPAPTWALEGSLNSRDLSIREKQISLSHVGLSTSVKLTPSRLELPEFTLSALRGQSRGRLEVLEWKRWKLSGQARGISVPELARIRELRNTQLNGFVSGPVQAEGIFRKDTVSDVRAEARLDLEPGPSGIALQGTLDFKYDQRANQLALGDSKVNLGSSHIQLSGTLGQTLTVNASSQNLNELLSALPLLGQPIPKDMPLALKGGTAQFAGTVSGPLANPRISGHLDVTKFALQGEDFDHLAGNFDLTDSLLKMRAMTLSQGATQVQGTGQLGLDRWRYNDSSAVSGSFTAQAVDLTKLLARAKETLPVSGTLSGTAGIRGTLGAPQGTADVRGESVTAYDERLDRVRAAVSLAGDTLTVTEARVNAASGQVEGKGSFQHAKDDWSSGQLRFEVTGRGLAVKQIKSVQDLREGVGGQADLTANGTANLTKGEFRIETVASQASVTNVSLDGRAYGSLNLTANNHEDMLDVRLNAKLLDTTVEGSGQWKLAGDDPGHGNLVIPRVSLATLHELVPSPSREKLPFEGYLEGTVAIDGPLRKSDQMKADIEIKALQVNASAGAKPRAGALPRDLVLRNIKPLLFDATTKGIVVRSAQLVGTDTTIDASGKLNFDAKNPWDLKVNGTINLAILQIFNPDLLGSGVSVVNATIRGPLAEPDVDGRMELKNASLYLTDLPTGLDQANGLIIFDRSRATVDSLTAVTGGGRVTIQKGSFVGFRGPVLLYRVQASADRVRYRSPEGVSITVNAGLNMIGTSENSVLSGTITVIRVGFNPTTDVGGLLANTARPVAAPTTPNEYLRGIQFDVRVESAQSLEIQTSLTRNIQAEANLRIRGTPERPVVLGNVTVNEGQIEFFGNTYRINRGEINFYNTAKIEPILDMDLETIVRGITVDISFTGSLNKLNFSYRSDPPLQANDIIALLAVGRTPNAANTLASSTNNSNTNYLSTGSNNLLSQAINAPAQGRLQRFFGVSHIKIDPQLSDITSVPQARLSLEQQVSKDVTLTYITNVTRTQEQILRLEWDLNRQWSVVALRDENGLFGIDFQYRRRFK